MQKFKSTPSHRLVVIKNRQRSIGVAVHRNDEHEVIIKDFLQASEPVSSALSTLNDNIIEN